MKDQLTFKECPDCGSKLTLTIPFLLEAKRMLVFMGRCPECVRRYSDWRSVILHYDLEEGEWELFQQVGLVILDGPSAGG